MEINLPLNSDPTTDLIVLLVGSGLVTINKIKEIWKNNGFKDSDLDPVIAEVDRRLARRS